MTPIPTCFVDIDPNGWLLSSMTVQIVILFVLVVALIIFSVMYLSNLWQHSEDSPTVETTSVALKSVKRDAIQSNSNNTKTFDKIKEKSPKKSQLINISLISFINTLF